MTLNRWKLVAGVLGLGMCGLAALAEPACRNTAAVNARMPEEKKPEVPVPGRKPNLELPSLPPPPVVNASTTTESLPLPGPTKVDFPAVGGLPVPTETTQPAISKLPDLPPASLPVPKVDEPTRTKFTELPSPIIPPTIMNDPVKVAEEMNKLPPLPTQNLPVTVPFSEAKNLPLPKAVEPLPEKPSTQKFAELPMPILPPTKLSDPSAIADLMNRSESFLPGIKTTVTAVAGRLENGVLIVDRQLPPPPPPSLKTIFTPPPIMAVADTQPVPTKPLTAAIDPVPPAPVAPPQLTPRMVVDETTTPLRPVSVEKKLRVQLNLGSGKPWLEIRDNEELVLKVVAEAVEVKAVGEGTEGLNVLKATGGVSFRTLGGNGTCDELRVVPGTGEVQLSGKVVVTSNWGKAETTATAEKMTFRLGSEPTGKK